jgi:flagellar L-ring protein precursor FlgH
MLGLLFLMLPMSHPASAMSLWNDNASLFADHKAHELGDIVTILVNESSSASRVGKAANTKSASASMDAGVGIFSWIGQASAGNSDSFSAAGSLTNTNNVAAKITAQIVEVKPNGTFVISGTQSIRQNGEEQKIIISGTIRPDDITVDNTVLSTYMSDAQIRIDGHGPIAGKQRQGILTQLFNIFF